MCKVVLDWDSFNRQVYCLKWEKVDKRFDPVTAFAAAQAAVKGVKAAIALGKDIQAVSGDLMKFFEAKDVVQKAASKPKSSFAQSDTAQAFEIVMQAKQLADAERELKQLLCDVG
jgi:hypothetical protein